MSEHVTEWLSAFMDGELRGNRLYQVEAHIAQCSACQAELESLQSLSALLREVPAPEFPAPERFTTRVNLRLPRALPRATRRKVQEVGWWMIPVSLLIVWVFFSTTALINDAIGAANEIGLLKDAPAWLISGSSTGASWSGTLEEFGLLGGDTLKWAEETEAFTRSTLPQFIWQVSIALLYLSWIAIWWARHTRRENGQLHEGKGRLTSNMN